MKKLFLLITFTIFSTSLFAKNWEELKASRLEQVNKRITALQETKSCLESAVSKQALQACNNAGKIKRKDMKKAKAKLKEDRKAKKETKKKVKEEKKK